MKRVIVSIGFVGAFVALGCSSSGASSSASALCSKQATCAKKSSTAFSESSCNDDLVEAEEKAQTAGCGDEYESYIDCVNGLDTSCSDDLGEAITAECGSKVKKLAKCTDEAVPYAQDECAAAADRVTARFEACGVAGSSSTDGDEEDDDSRAECTEEAAKASQRIADCVDAAACEVLQDPGSADPDAVKSYSDCVSNP